MAKSFVLGNGSMAVGLDAYGQVYDLYFPYVGLENHTGGRYVHKIGCWVDGKFSWLDDGSWEIKTKYANETELEKLIIAKNDNLQIEMQFQDEVYNEKNILLREIKITNLADNPRKIKFFYNNQFEIYESYRGDTVYFEPEENVIIHYKGRRLFLINAMVRSTKQRFDQYSVGLFGIEGKEGTFKDAEDGILGGNPIEHGLTDSVIGLEINLEPHADEIIDYWLVAAKTLDELFQLNNYVVLKGSSYLIKSTNNYWKAWTKSDYDFKDLSKDQIALFKNSLKMLRIHTDNTGAVIASTDADLLKYGRDSYSYVWPRDAAFTSMAFSRAGYDDINKKIFDFFNNTITKQGYFMHKYRADRSPGSSWHPWIYKGIRELPIQLDETALVVCAIWEDYLYSKDIEFIEQVYNSLVKKAIDFIISRIDKTTGLIKPSYDLWEEKFGTSTFMSTTVYGALMAASELARIFGKDERADEYLYFAKLVQKGITDHLYSNEKGHFIKHYLDKQWEHETYIDDRIDSSTLYGLFKFKVLDLNNEMFISTQKAVEEKLMCKNGIGGIARYEGDSYFKNNDVVAGNPWVITTLWFAQILIAQSKTYEDLQKAKFYLDWANEHASDSGILSEQLDPVSGWQLSASPLTWSHSEYVVTVLDYIKKFESLTT